MGTCVTSPLEAWAARPRGKALLAISISCVTSPLEAWAQAGPARGVMQQTARRQTGRRGSRQGGCGGPVGLRVITQCSRSGTHCSPAQPTRLRCCSLHSSSSSRRKEAHWARTCRSSLFSLCVRRLGQRREGSDKLGCKLMKSKQSGTPVCMLYEEACWPCCSGVWYPRRRPCGVAINTSVDFN